MADHLRWGMLALTPVTLFTLPLAAFAQQATPVSAMTAVCLASPPSGDPGVPGIVIVVPSDQASAMAGRGYTAQPCSPDPNDFATYRSDICALAASAPSTMQDQIKQTYKASPSELCDLATRLVS